MKESLINNLTQQGYLRTPLIINAFKKIDRMDFVLPVLKDSAYVNTPLPIGDGQTISQPLTVAFMFELLQPQRGDKVLDIGSGSGWTTALLAEIVGRNGKIFAMELIPELCNFGMENVSKYFSFTNNKEDVRAEFLCTDGSKGYPNEAPFDKILVSAAAKKFPEELKKQIKIGGRIVIPIKNSIWLVERATKSKFKEEEHYGFSFVPLIK